MASTLDFLLFFCFIFLITSSSSGQIPRSQNALTMVLPVTKDASSLQYVIRVRQGTSMGPTELAVDLGGPFLWVDCGSGHVSSSRRSINSGSLQCSRATANGNSCLSGPATSPNTCALTAVNTITRVAARGDLAEDIVAVEAFDRSGRIGSITTVDRFLLLCAPQLLLKGLASGAKGMLGLGRTRLALPSQLAAELGFRRKFAVCLSPSVGVILSGDLSYASISPPDVSNSLIYTPLISNQHGTSEQYYMNIRSIEINGKKLALDASKLAIDQNGLGGTQLSTIVPYTTMESIIYDTFTRAYINVATAMNMTRVAPVAPFGVCFSSDGLEKTVAGPAVPEIDLVLQSEMVKWKIYGRNSMVEVSEGVVCLGFLDGGVSPGASIVIGGYQLEDNLLEFNLDTSMLGFSSSLLMRETSCSSFKLYSRSSESL